ncbi:PREDICTED: odorant receptor 22c-like [Vollenhovia emeryi]|uniref:odorant receptor 22c-like n=1 Tax=Vollenhovia emeryi TaxID=411798 RepID=UPI0005F580BC|nr:PREDICTED: odorant receptor 22c-like [Vollenhovia emeryi]
MGQAVEWNSDTAHVLTLHKYLLGILGLWVLDEETRFSRIRWFMSTIIELSATISLSLEVIYHCRGHEDALDAFLSASTSITSISKLLLHRVNWRHKLILVESVINDWTVVNNCYSREIMLKYARISRLVSLVFLYFGCASCVFLFSPFILANFNLLWTTEEQIYNKTSEWKLLLAAYCVFGSYTSFAYGLIEVLQALQILVNCISQCGNDGFFFNLTMHVCGQFEVLRMDFSQIDSKELLSRNRLGILLKRHHRLIYLAHHLQKAFSLVILSQLLMSVILLCVEGFQLILTLSMNNTYAATKHLLFIVVLLMQLFLYCFAGQTLEFQSQGLVSAIYNSPWYNFDTSVMKNLPFMILRAAHPHQLTAGKFLAINFISFKEILKASASYLSVLRVMLET